MAAPRRARNAGTAIVLSAVVVGMLGLVAASVPLYRLFCQVTGYGGTTQTAVGSPEAVTDRVVTVRFNADVDPALPWTFRPEQGPMTLRIGERGLAYFKARNDADRPVTGVAVYNVTPQKVGLYFNKVQCFCFSEQRLAPGEEADMPVSFFVDPAIMDDPNLDDVTTVTLSYTFFSAEDGEDAGDAGEAEDAPRRRGGEAGRRPGEGPGDSTAAR